MFDDTIFFKRKHARLAIAAPLVIAVIAQLAMVAAVVFVAWSSDRNLAARQHDTVENYLEMVLAEERKSVLDYALWDKLVDALAELPEKSAFLVDDFASNTSTYSDAITAAIVAPDGRTLFVSHGDEEADPTWYAENCPRCDAVVAAVQKMATLKNTSFKKYDVAESYSARPELPDDFPVVAEFADLGGEPVVVTAAPIARETPSERGDGPYRVLVEVIPLEKSWMKDMRTDTGISTLRLAAPNTPGGVPVVATANGATIGKLVWEHTTPAADLLFRISPITLGFHVVFTGLVLALSRWLKRMAVDQVAGEALGTHHATHDALTGLGNRVYLGGQLDIALPMIREAGRTAALLLLDLDGFKGVNDTYGHAAGDDLIRQFADRLVRGLPRECRIARLGGDEFAVLMPSIAQQSEAEAAATRVLALARAPFDIDGTEARVGCSVGIAFAPAQAIDRSDWMRKADIALYRAKGEGRNRYRVFAPEFDQRVRERREAEESLRAALADTGRFEIVYRPILSLSEGAPTVRGREAVLHIRDAGGRLVAAKSMIRMAEEAGLSAEVGSYVLRRVASDAARFGNETIRVTAQPGEVASQDFADRVLMIIDETDLPPRRLEIVLTDGLQHAASRETVQQLSRLRAAGIGLCLDGFGAGYANLSQLRALPLDRIRIAGTLMRGVATSPGARYILTAVVDLAHSLGLQVSAGLVDRPEELLMLRDLGCTEVLGAAPGDLSAFAERGVAEAA